MKNYYYTTDIYVQVWERLNIIVNAETKEEADALIIQVAKDNPFSMDDENGNIEIVDNEFLLDTETLVDKEDNVQVFNAQTDVGIYNPEDAIYRNLKATHTLKNPLISLFRKIFHHQ